jgi:hypothetical protein
MGLSVRTGLALLRSPGRQKIPPGLPGAWSWVPNATKASGLMPTTRASAADRVERCGHGRGELLVGFPQNPGLPAWRPSAPDRRPGNRI